ASYSTPSDSTTRHAPDRLGPPALPLRAGPATPAPPRTDHQEGADTLGTTTLPQPNNPTPAADTGARARLAPLIRTLITPPANQPTPPPPPPGRRHHRGHTHPPQPNTPHAGGETRRRPPPRPDDPHPHHHHRQPGPALRATPHRPLRSRQPLHPRPRLQAP